MVSRYPWSRCCAWSFGLLVFTSFARPAPAATWLGGDGNWSESARWSPQSVPNSQSTDVVIDGNASVASTVEMDMQFGATARALTVDSGDTLSLGQSNRYLTLHGNATINGKLVMAGSNVRLIMAGGGNKTIGGAGEIDMRVGQGGIDAGFNWTTSITIGPNITIRGGGGLQGGPVLVNNGTIVAENSLGVYGVTNNATIRATSSGSLQLYAAWDNNGTITLDDGAYLTLGGTFDTDDIGTIHRGVGTTVGLLGQWNNAGRTVDLSASTGTVLLNTGTITGGTIASSSGDARLVVFGYQGANTLDGVTLATSPVFADSNRQLTVANVLTLDNITIDLSDGANNRTGNRLTGGSLAGAGTVLLGTRQAGINADNQLTTATIGPGLLVRGSGSVSAVNQGTIRADIPAAKVVLWHVENDGLIHATNSSGLATTGSRPFVNRGTVRVDAGSTLNVGLDQGLTHTAGHLRVNGSVTAHTVKMNFAGGTLAGVGTFTATTSTLAPRMNFGGTISPGTTDDGEASIGALTVATNLTFAPGSHYLAEIDGASADLLKIVAGSTFAGDLQLGPDTSLDLQASDDLLYGVPYLIASYAGSRTGEFAQVTPGFVVDYSQPKAIYVTALVPEPHAVALLACAAVAAAGMRRRRSRLP